MTSRTSPAVALKARFSYTAIQVEEMNRSVRFYTSILDMKQIVRKKVKETNGELCVLTSGGNTLELNQYYNTPFNRGGTLDHLAFRVSNLERFMKKARDATLDVHDFLETKGWRRCFVDDPDGNWIEVYQRLEHHSQV
jgi:catechol 2,3-dioxygenase-like lactoylglutathione lyase family enzyme